METEIIDKFNKVIGNALEFLPDFDMQFDLDGRRPSFTEENVVENRLQFHRAGKKFIKPSRENSTLLRQRAWESSLATEAYIQDKFSSDSTTQWISSNASLLRSVRLEITRILSSFSIDWAEDPGFGPGEQFISSGGKISEFDKLAEHDWTCTEECFPLFARAMYANRSTRRTVWKRCDRRLPLDPVMLKRPEYRFAYFTEHLRLLTTFVRGNRFTSVFKNLDTDRGICVEALGNLYCQKAIGTALKRCHEATGNDLWSGQMDHAEMISDSNVSTIDFSSASDSIHFGWIKLLFPPWFVTMIASTRSRATLYEDEFFHQRKVSSMGNGFTFELMSLLLLAVCRVCGDSNARVYGDDVIISNAVAPIFIDVATHLGFQVNELKSFVAVEFRESCGAFFFGRYLRSYDIKYITNALEARATLNKIYLLGLNNYWFRELWNKMIILVPNGALGPVPIEGCREDNLSAYYWSDDYSLLTNGATRWIESAYCRHDRTIHKVQTYQPVAVDMSIEDTSLHRYVDQSLRLKNRRPTVRALRQDTGDLRVQSITIFVDNQGFLMTKQRYKHLRACETNYLLSTFEVDVLSREHWAAWHID